MRLFAFAICGVLAACSTDSDNESAAPNAGAGGSNSNKTLGLDVNAVIDLELAGTSQDSGSNAIGVAQHFGSEDQFWVRASNPQTRVFRYGRPGSGMSGMAELRRHNFRVPITSDVVDGVTLNTGSLTVTRSAPGDLILPNPVDARVFTMREVPLTHTLAGVLEVDETRNSSGSALHAYGYAGGTTPLGVSGSATYSGTALATVLADDGSLTRHVGDAELTVDFDGATMSGALHGGAITLSGTQTGPDFSGTATVATGALGLTAASSGSFDGAVFGPGGEEAGGALGITDSNGSQRLSGAFGATRN